MKKTILKSALLAIASVGLLAGTSSAVLIDGDISFASGTGDYVVPVDSSWNSTVGQPGDPNGFLGAAGFTFFDSDDTNYSDGFNAVVTLSDGDFAALMGSGASFSDGLFNPFTSPSQAWTAGDFTFNLTSISVTHQSVTGVSIDGSGIVSAPGFEDTAGKFSYSTQRGGTWSASSQVPEPGTLLIFGTGLIGLAGYRRQKSKKA